MNTYRADAGLLAAFLHFLLGAVFGAVMFGFISWFFVAPTLIIALAMTGAAVMGTCAAIWRSRFWTALANNPFYQMWRAFYGRK